MLSLGEAMPPKAIELEKLILKDGWYFVRQVGSHKQYKHPTKPGTVTIPFHSKEVSIIVEHSVRKQAGLKK